MVYVIIVIIIQTQFELYIYDKITIIIEVWCRELTHFNWFTHGVGGFYSFAKQGQEKLS